MIDVAVMFVFLLVALCGLYAAKRPRQAAKMLLANWQRENVSDAGLIWTGWALFGLGLATVAFMGLELATRTR